MDRNALGRYREIALVPLKNGFGDLARVRLTLEQLGPTFVKFGQALSVRGDLLPAAFIDELAELQDAVAADRRRFNRADAADVIRRAKTDRLQIQFVHRNLDHFVREMDRLEQPSQLRHRDRRAADWIVDGDRRGRSSVFGYSGIGLAGFVAAAVLGLGFIAGVRRSGRR